MQKTYWWRKILTGVSSAVLLISYVGPCNFKFTKCLGGNSIPLERTIFHIFLTTLIISLVLFLVSDRIFLKWFRFAIVWIILSIILIAVTPEYPGGWMPLGPGRELVSLWLGGLFVVLSLGKIIWDVAREKMNK